MRFDAVMFKYPLHNQILRILQAIDSAVIESPQSVVDGLDRLAAMFSIAPTDRQNSEI
jgi:hypothetical protein